MGRGDRQGRATGREIVGAAPRREQAKVADADEAFRQDVQEKASEEFVDVERQRADLTPVPIVLPPKRDGVVGDGDEPVIGDGDAVRVPREVVQHVGGTAKGRLRVDHPGLAIERSETRAKGALRGERLRGCPESAAGPARNASRKPATSFPRKTCRSTFTGRKKRGRAWIHRAPIGGETAGGHDTVDVRMMLQALPPRVQDHEPADRGTEAFRVGGDLEQRRRGGAEEEVVHDALVDEREARQQLRHREDDVHVADRQEFLLARRHPGVAGGGEALGTMPIPTAVVREGRLRALVTAIAMPAERRRAALDEGPEHAPMLARHPGAVRLQETIAVSAHDVGHLEGWPRHRLCFRRVRARCRAPRSCSASSGFATACRCLCERWR